MPNYRFTTAVDGEIDHADEPMAYPTEKAATDAAQDCLVEMARDKLPNGKHAEFAATIRDEAGEEIYRATMTFNAKAAEDIAADEREAEAAFDDLRKALAPVQNPSRTS